MIFRVISLPESVPAINFAAYKARIPVAGMVDNFEKEYEALKVPYPEDTVSQQIAEVEGQAVSEFCHALFLPSFLGLKFACYCMYGKKENL